MTLTGVTMLHHHLLCYPKITPILGQHLVCVGLDKSAGNTYHLVSNNPPELLPVILSASNTNPYNADFFFVKTMETKGFFNLKSS